MKGMLYAAVVVALLVPGSALAMFSCDGTLTKDNFVDERKKAQNELQNTILEYRKVEAAAAGSADGKTKLAEIKAKIDRQKKAYLALDSKYFPNTPVTAFGSACNDKRWLEEAKAKLVEKPEHLGKHWYVWLDKTTRNPMAAVTRPSFDVMAE